MGARPTDGGAFEAYVSEIARHPLLDREEEGRLARRWAVHGDREAFDRLVRANLRYVVKVAGSYRGYGLPIEDLVQEGNLGLIHGIRKFQPDQNVRLLTYATWWIRAYIRRYVLSQWSLVRRGTTRLQRELSSRLAAAQRELTTRYGLEAATDPLALARHLGARVDDVRAMLLTSAGRDVSLNARLGDDDELEAQDLLTDDRPAADTLLAAREGREFASRTVARALERLDDRDRRIVEARLLAEDPDTLQVLGARFGVSRERTRQIEGRARRRLRLVLAAVRKELEEAADGGNAA